MEIEKIMWRQKHFHCRISIILAFCKHIKCFIKLRKINQSRWPVTFVTEIMQPVVMHAKLVSNGCCNKLGAVDTNQSLSTIEIILSWLTAEVQHQIYQVKIRYRYGPTSSEGSKGKSLTNLFQPLVVSSLSSLPCLCIHLSSSVCWTSHFLL